MSSHGSRSRGRHPDPKSFERESFSVGHVTFEIADKRGLGEGRDCSTFALVPGEALHAKDRRAVFSGFIGPDMADELRALAARLDPICFDLRKAAAARDGVSS